MGGSVNGVVFDIKELAVFDGPGIRTTVFLKGCPLRCQWCHNPEGLSARPQLLVSAGCTSCGACRAVCEHPQLCTACGKCLRACPLRLRKICGYAISAAELAEYLLRDKSFLEKNGGGVTFSGGEPLMQPPFLLAALQALGGLHKAVETSACCDPRLFAEVVLLCDLVIMDVKLVDSALHRQYTGVDNSRILANLEQLKNGDTPFVVRVPLIPGVNDTEDNLEQTAALLAGSTALQSVELLPYHITAGAKYASAGLRYSPDFDTNRAPRTSGTPFARRGIPWRVL